MEEDPLTSPPADANLSTVVVTLFKGVLYRDNDETLWNALLNLQARVRDYAAVLDLDLSIDEAEGYAFLRSRPDTEEDEPSPRLPRLVARRPLTFQVSLLLALLRRKLLEMDVGGGDSGGSRLILSRDDIVELVRVFLPDGTNEAKLVDHIETTINKTIELGFLRKLKPADGGASSGGLAHYEVRRILKAFVDAQWLSEFDARLAQYRAHLENAGETDSASQRTQDDDER